MKTTIRFVTFIVVLLIGLADVVQAQVSDAANRRTAIMNGNQVRTVFGNWGVIGQPGDQGHRGAWRNDNDGYVGDVSIFVGAEINWKGTVFHSVATCPVDRPTQLRDQDPITNAYWTFEPQSGYFNANKSKVAISNDPTSWPPFWPDKLNDLSDPGWRTNPDASLSQYPAWNGYFGKKISADLETYFVMDDNNDKRFNFYTNNIWGVSFKPDSTDLTRNGMGLTVKVRAMQWSQFLAKDNIFWLYEVTNGGTTTYSKTVFGMLVGTYVGVTSTENYQEYSDDWSFYDPKVNLTYTGDFKAINGQPMKNPLWVGGTGLVGYAFLESPGNPYDGIDNDGDADSSAFGRTAPQFQSADFDSVTIVPGQRIVLINDDFTRVPYTVPSNVDSVQIYTRGMTFMLKPGKTRVAEGNRLSDPAGNVSINSNAYDGIDNNFNGLIDENYAVHFRQTKSTRTVPPVVLFDILRPLRHKNYLTSAGTSQFSMIDEARNDLIDNNQNWDYRYDDVGRDGVPNTHDFGEGDGLPTSGYDLNYKDTGLPGEPHMDKTDVNESDQIGLTSFYYFEPSNAFKLGDKEALWTQLRPGSFDVPGNINFDAVNGGKPTGGSDGDFIYGSGYFPLLAKSTERFSLALVYGGGNGGGLTADLADLKKNKNTVQKIYDANYQFPQPPDKPVLTAVPGNHSVTLYWDRRAEATIDPVLRTKIFEGYRIYKSTSPDFSDIFTITDASGSPQGYKWLQQFDVVDGIKGYFQAPTDLFQGAAGYSYYLGNDNGLVHSYVDNEVDNGRTYYYALVAYSKGDQVLGIYPAENTHQISILATGEVFHDINTAVVVPNAKTAGYAEAKDGVSLAHTSVFGSGSSTYHLVDPTKLKNHHYSVQMFDTQVDSMDINDNPVVSLDSTKWTRITTRYNVRDNTPTTEFFTSLDTAIASLAHKNLIASTVSVRNSAGTLVDPSKYTLNAALGSIKGVSSGSLPAGKYSVTYQYYPVYRSPNIQGSPFLTDSRDADNFDGLSLVFSNIWNITEDTSKSHWTKTQAYTYSFSPLLTSLGAQTFTGYRKPSDYAIIFSNANIDTSFYDAQLAPFTQPVNFTIRNLTDTTKVNFIYADFDGNGVLSNQDELVFVEKDPRGKYSYTWDLVFDKRGSVDSLYKLGSGDTLFVRTLKPFRYGDVFDFTPTLPASKDSIAKANGLHVRVVPNPYVTASSFEPPLNPGITSGRGTRKIDFIHLPPSATIKIFTVRGDYIATLHHDGNIEDGTVSWNLRTYENLDVAYGVYFYVVESPMGNTTGKIAIIK
jgi:hypothetical protein